MTEGRRSARYRSRGGGATTYGTLAALLAPLYGCAPPVAVPPVAPIAGARDAVRELPSRPPLASVVRDGDPRGAVAFDVLTAGVGDGARTAVALGAVTAARLAAAGETDATVAATPDGYRVRVLLPEGGDAARVVHAVREALLAPVGPTDVVSATEKLGAFAAHPLDDPALVPFAACRGVPVPASPATSPVDAASLEHWRAGSQGLGRVVVGAAGTAGEVDGVAHALLAEAAWPQAAAVSVEPAAAALPRSVYDASGVVAAGAARVTIAVEARSAELAIDAAERLGDPDGPLLARLRVSLGSSLRDVTATARPGGGCVVLTLDVPRDEHRADVDTDARLAAITTLAEEEATLALATHDGEGAFVRRASLASDPRDAADLAAWWALVGSVPSTAPAGKTARVAIGLGTRSEPFAARASSVTDALARAAVASRTHAVEARVAVERGQGGVWVLVGSPCGVLAEGESDAGVTAFAAAAVAEAAREHPQPGIEVSDWVTADGVGLVVHVDAVPGESADARARRAGDAAGRAFFAGGLDDGVITRTRATLATSPTGDDARSFATLAEALAPGQPSWLLPVASGRRLEDASDGAVKTRVAALRHGPVRVAVLADLDAAEGESVVAVLDRWMPRIPPPLAACPTHATPPAAKPGTYAATPSSMASTWLALPIPRDARDVAETAAGALDGADGLLGHALANGLASSWSARVVGPDDAPALVVHVTASNGALDAATAQTRALLDRLRQGAFTDEDLARTNARLARASLARMLDPRQRLVRLWRGDTTPRAATTLDSLRAFAAKTLRDDALVIVAARPPLAKASP